MRRKSKIPTSMTDAAPSPDSDTAKATWLCRLDWLCPLLLATVPMLACSLLLLLSPDISWRETESFGRTLLNSLYYYIGAAGMFYMVNPGRSEQWARILIWGIIQLGGAWFISVPGASFCPSLGADGWGMAIAWFGPLLTLPSFLVAVLFALILSRKSNLNRVLCCRIISALILTGIIATVLCRCTSAEIEARQFSNYAEWFKHTHPNYEYAPTGTNPR